MIVREYATTDYVEAHNTSELAHDDIRTSINDLNTLVGDTPVSQQISEAFNDFEAITNDEIDTICNALIYSGEEVEL